MHKCSQVHESMTRFTELQHTTSDQHVEMGKSRVQGDIEDLTKISQWFDIYDPFLGKDSLHCISSGLAVSNESDINCDQVEEVGAVIQEQINNIVYSGISLKRKDVVKQLTNLIDGVKLGKSTVHIDPTALFTRLLVLVERADDMAPYFQYELTQIPSSLFQDGRMRKAAKASLGTLLIKEVTMETVRPTERYVLDGGALLHRVKWKGKGTYNDVAEQYPKYITSKYDKCTVVFDGNSSDRLLKIMSMQEGKENQLLISSFVKP